MNCPICEKHKWWKCNHTRREYIMKIKDLSKACFRFQGKLAEKDAIIRELDPNVIGWDVKNQKVIRK